MAHQVLVLVGLLVTYGIAAVAALGAEKAIRPSGFYVALPAPAWILDHSGRTPAQRHLPVAWQRWTLPGMLWHTENQRPDPGRGMNAESQLFLKQSTYTVRCANLDSHTQRPEVCPRILKPVNLTANHD